MNWARKLQNKMSLQDPLRLWRASAPLALFSAGVIGFGALLSASLGWLALALAYAAWGGLAWLWPVPPVPKPTSASPSASPAQDDHLQYLVTMDGLARAAEAINDLVTRQTASAAEQSQVIQLTGQLIDEFLHMAERISQQARQVNQTAQQAVSASHQGQEALDQSLHSMQDIRQQVQSIGQTITTLANLTKRIDDIITSVGEIATQSNLLSLNAAIEAARAGEHGRGFAVVADEVRRLSQQSTQAAAQVRAILSEIQRAMKDSIRTTQAGLNSTQQGIERTREADQALNVLADHIRAAQASVSQISAVLQSQHDRVEEIAIGMDRIGKITEQNVASARAFEAIAANLTRLAHELQSSTLERL
ncbi:MAG: methyl-accepting chemotaxis protein [Anaerolineae bacterium]|nr:methyl-accepting chemotaxis protein [Anaerolineae bacterium]MDW8171923.1 methyl-accepting chemotaxis protein [Anaerolineae bacterium]